MEHWTNVDAAQVRAFLALQERDGWPDHETGKPGHCPSCHGVYTDGPHCAHTFGCPEC